MQTILAFALLVVGISAIPTNQNIDTNIDFRNERLVSDSIASVIQEVSQQIKDRGLDPFHIESESGDYALPVPVLFSAEGLIEEFLFTGLSEIVINNINYSILTSRLTFDISLPLIELTLKKANVGVVLFGEELSASASGRLAIVNLRVAGNVRVSIGIISGISIRSIDINFSIGDIQSALNVVFLNLDLSAQLNTFIGTTVPNKLTAYKSEINELLEILALDIINDLL